MAIFDKEKLQIIWEEEGADLSKASLSKNLSAVDYDSEGKYFYITVDKVLFSNPAAIIKSVLDAHGYVSNLENILSCLDSFVFSIRARVPDKEEPQSQPARVNEYLPCIRFELPQTNKVGHVLQSFYDEIAKYEATLTDPKKAFWSTDGGDKESDRALKKEIRRLEADNKALQEQVTALTQRLIAEQKSLSRASRALDSQQNLPENTKICRVEQVDLKRRIIKVKAFRKLIDVPTHMLDRVPEFQARCLIMFDDDEQVPLGVLFFDNEELDSIEKRTAELLYVEGDSFKARDSLRNEFQIKAVNELEADSIKSLRRGMKVLISIADDYVVRFSVLNSANANHFTRTLQEQFTVYEIGRNQLIDVNDDATDP
ncbi:hypothetical protein FKG94_08970 [Exilibacterium tricleocarpae]|uniref:Uncharacterized protein n=1 Tax=Exilibacterium tricleocarpae TaxID=2591008 RepID=A0A545TVH8_9GAMM|nr:hypothetical protein [Exilibacterium tricleocarpae]TQV81225.1 hypothetical protein FKG94_08970 [Exilibacterium tricleocarpae]